MAEKLYHEHVKHLPIIDYHNHLPPNEIASDHQFDNLSQIWLNGDHYKWRAMRAMGVDEVYITGNANDREKFKKWAQTVPYTLRNPLYHWTHLELQRYFDIDILLNENTADEIYDHTQEKLQSAEFSVQGLLRKMNVEVLCTTDDPSDSLEYHLQIAEQDFQIKVLPTFRPDKLYAIENPDTYLRYLEKLGSQVGFSIDSFQDLIKAAKNRIEFFSDLGCSLSDHGLEQLYANPLSATEASDVFQRVKIGQPCSAELTNRFKATLLLELCKMYHQKEWTQQFHLGALRNNNSRMLATLGPDTGYDSMGDFSQGSALSSFLDQLDANNQLTKTILYNLNPRDNELFATMVGNFNDGLIAGKMQYGAGWWFLDQLDGMERQLNAVSNMGLLSQFVGMLTDSRSFLSFPRHEYFRRLLCNMIGTEVTNGLIPNDEKLVGEMVQNICYYNAKKYFEFDSITSKR